MKKVIFIYLYNFLIIIVLCCAYCLYKNLHNGHKIIPIEDEETLKKENLNVNDYIKDFDEFSKNVINIKEKIENEIKNINESYEKMDKELKNHLN